MAVATRLHSSVGEKRRNGGDLGVPVTNVRRSSICDLCSELLLLVGAVGS